MSTVRLGSLAELRKVLPRDIKRKQTDCTNATRKAARKLVGVVKKAVPVAFGQLRESVGAEPTSDGARVVVDAPYAAAVEVGSRPHMVPLPALVAWVKLRGMQGLASDRQLARLPGSSTARHACNIAGQLRGGVPETGATQTITDADAPYAIAKAIQARIAQSGTKPHWYARDSLGQAMTILDEQIELALAGPGGGS